MAPAAFLWADCWLALPRYGLRRLSIPEDMDAADVPCTLRIATASDGLTIQNDSIKGDDFYRFLLQSLTNMVTRLEPGGTKEAFSRAAVRSKPSSCAVALLRSANIEASSCSSNSQWKL